MKFKVVAIGMIAANFTFTSMAHSQQYGYGLYGGNAPCGYAGGPASGATSEDDELADLIQQRRDLRREVKELERSFKGERETIGRIFKPNWSDVFLYHMDLNMNCNVCGDDNRPPVIVPRPEPRPPVQPPVQNEPPVQNQPPVRNDPGPPPVPPRPPVVVPRPPVNPNPPVQGTTTPRPPPVVIEPVKPTPTPTPKPTAPQGVDPGPKVDPNAAYKRTRAACVAKYGGDPSFKKLSEAAKTRYCAQRGYQASNDTNTNDLVVASSDRMPASESGGRAPASYNETGTTGGGGPRSAPAVEAGADVPNSAWSEADFDGGAGAYGDSGGPALCYPRNTEPYGRRSWKTACRPHGGLNPEICRIPNYLQDRDSLRSVAKCQSAIKNYLKDHDAYEAAQNELEQVESDIKELKHDARSRAADDRILEASASRRSQGGGGGRAGPSFGQSLLGVGLGLAAGAGTYALINGSARRDFRQNNAALTSLGWQTLPYQDNGAALGAGLGVFSAVSGGLNGAFGCGQIPGGVNGGIFGNPYGGNPYGQMGGGMYNGAGPWGMSGPGGGFGASIGGGFGAGGGYGGPGGGFGGQGGFGG